MSKLTLAAGIALLWLREHRLDRCIRRQLLILTLSFLCAGFLALAVSYAHFGTPGGERYETLRRCWILMSFIAAAVVVLGSKGYSGMRQRLSKSSLGPVLILTGIAMSWHLTPLVRQYSVYGEVVDAVRQTFQSGLEPGSHQMTYITAPLAGVITPATIPPGIYMRTSPATDYDYAAYVLSYFNKDVLVVRSSDGTPSGAIASPAP